MVTVDWLIDVDMVEMMGMEMVKMLGMDYGCGQDVGYGNG